MNFFVRQTRQFRQIQRYGNQALSLSVLFLISFSYMFFTLGSLGNVWNFMVDEFLQLFVYPGTQQPTFTILNEVL